MRGRSDLRLGAALLGLVIAGSLFGPWIVPHSADRPFDPVAARYRPPGTRVVVAEAPGGATRVLSTAPGTEAASASLPPGTAIREVTFPLGTDRYGRDLLARLLAGGRVSLAVGLAAALAALALGTAVGLAAALGGRLVDAVLMRAADGLLAFPRLFLVLAAVGLGRSGGLGLVVAVLALTGWMEVARVVRAEAAALREREFVLAARAAGLHPATLVGRHLLPHVVPAVLVLAALRVGDAILTEAALSYLGFGVQPPRASWGNLIAEGQAALGQAWWVSVFPGLAIAATVFAANLLAEGLQERWNPERHLELPERG